MSAVESLDAPEEVEQSEGARGYNLSPARRAFVVEHAQQPGWTTGRMAAALGVPPFIVSGWLGRRDVAEAIQAHTFERTKEQIAHLANAPRVKTPLAEPPPHMQNPQAQLASPSARAAEVVASDPYVGVEVTGSGAVLTRELKEALLGEVRALCREQAREVMRNELRAELRELVLHTVRRAFVELVEALEPLTSETTGAVDEGERAHGER